MAFDVTLTPNQLAADAVLDIAGLNLLGTPTVAVTGPLAGADDVDPAAPENGQALVWNATSELWEPGSPGATVGAAVNFQAVRQDAAAAKIDVLADSAVLVDSSGMTRVISNVSLTVDALAAVGPNALDFGVLTTGWYYLWLIYDGTNKKGLLSLQSSWASVVKTNITGYTFACLVGELYAENATTLRPFIQVGRVTYTNQVQIFTAGYAAAAQTWEVLSDAGGIGNALTAFRTAVGPLAKRCTGVLGTTTDNPNRSMVGACLAGGTLPSDPIGRCVLTGGSAAALNGPHFYSSGPFTVPVIGGASRNIAWKTETGAVGSVPRYRMEITGYEI